MDCCDRKDVKIDEGYGYATVDLVDDDTDKKADTDRELRLLQALDITRNMAYQAKYQTVYWALGWIGQE